MDNASNISDQAILTEVTAFLNQGTTNQKKQLCQFLQEQPRHVPLDSILSEKELPTKLELIEELHRRLSEEFGTPEMPVRFSNIKIAALSFMSVETLQDLRQDGSCMLNDLALFYHLPFLVHGTFPRFRHIAVSMMTKIASKCIYRNNKGHKKRFLRDRGVCVLTKATDAIPCYIAPVDLTTGQNDMDTFTDSILMSKLMGDVGVQIRRIMAIDSFDAFKKSWNRLYLHPTLCTWWSECLFGLKYLEMATNNDGSTVIRIQFNWMPVNKKINPHRCVEPPYDSAINAMLQTTATDEQRDFFYPLASGASFEVTVGNKEEALKMKAALEFQWLAVRLATMSGVSKNWTWGQEQELCEDESDGDGEDDGDFDMYEVEDEE